MDPGAAAEALKRAIDVHLAALEHASSTDEVIASDSDVSRAYRQLARAVKAYDDALWDHFEEVTPWEVKSVYETDEGEPASTAPVAEFDVVSVIGRWDYNIRDRNGLTTFAAQLDADLDPSTDLGNVFYELIHQRGHLFNFVPSQLLEPREDAVAVFPRTNDTLDVTVDGHNFREWLQVPDSEPVYLVTAHYPTG